MKTNTMIAAVLLALYPLAAAMDIEEFRRRAEQGLEGVNPQLQTRARSGDPYAIAQISRTNAVQLARQQYAAGTITAEQAQAAIARADMEYQLDIQRIQQEEILREMQRTRQEIERNNEYHRQRAYGNRRR